MKPEKVKRERERGHQRETKHKEGEETGSSETDYNKTWKN